MCHYVCSSYTLKSLIKKNKHCPYLHIFYFISPAVLWVKVKKKIQKLYHFNTKYNLNLLVNSDWMHTVVQHPVWKGFEPSLDCRTIWETILSGDSWEGSCACCTHTGPASKDTPRMLPLLCGESRLDTRCGNSQAFFWDGWYQRKAFPSVPGNAQRMPFACCDRTHPLLFGPIWMKKNTVPF